MNAHTKFPLDVEPAAPSGKLDVTAAVGPTPADLEIVVRDQRFGRAQKPGRWWLGGDPVATALHTGKRILVILIAWSLIYLLLPLDFSSLIDPKASGPLDAVWQNMVEIARHPQTLLLQGTKLHLWYLVALLCALAISAFFLSLRQPQLLAVAAIALYVLGLLGKSYLESPLGLDLGINTRNGPFAGTLLFATGYWLSGQRIDNRWALYGLGVFALGYALHFTEILALWKAYGRGPKAHDYTIGTFVMGVGFAMAALSDHPALRSPMLARFGQMTLGIYAVHFAFVDLLRPVDGLTDHPLWEVGYVFLVLGLALLSTWLLSLNRITRKIVV